MKKLRISKLYIIALVFCISAAAIMIYSFNFVESNITTENSEKEINMFSDPSCSEGFGVTGLTSSVPYLGNITPPGKESSSPQWNLAQWFCKYNLLDGEIKNLGKNSYSISTASQTVTVNKNIITLELKASKEYAGHIRKYGETWPHLYLAQTLIDQSNLKYRCPEMSKLKELRLKIDSRLVYSECKMTSPDPNIHSSQFSICFTVQNLKNGDYLWFLVPLYDARYDLVPEYKAQDTGKADATGKYIYTPAQKNFTAKSLKSNEWVSYDTDLLPFIKDAVKVAKEKGYLVSNDVDSLKVTSMWIGWEITGIYDSSLEFKNFSLTAIE